MLDDEWTLFEMDLDGGPEIEDEEPHSVTEWFVYMIGIACIRELTRKELK